MGVADELAAAIQAIPTGGRKGQAAYGFANGRDAAAELVGASDALRRLEASHAALLAACKAMLSGTGDCGYDCRQGDVMDAGELARAAIKAAGGE